MRKHRPPEAVLLLIGRRGCTFTYLITYPYKYLIYLESFNVSCSVAALRCSLILSIVYYKILKIILVTIKIREALFLVIINLILHSIIYSCTRGWRCLSCNLHGTGVIVRKYAARGNPVIDGKIFFIFDLLLCNHNQVSWHEWLRLVHHPAIYVR